MPRQLATAKLVAWPAVRDSCPQWNTLPEPNQAAEHSSSRGNEAVRAKNREQQWSSHTSDSRLRIQPPYLGCYNANNLCPGLQHRANFPIQSQRIALQFWPGFFGLEQSLHLRLFCFEMFVPVRDRFFPFRKAKPHNFAAGNITPQQVHKPGGGIFAGHEIRPRFLGIRRYETGRVLPNEEPG